MSQPPPRPWFRLASMVRPAPPPPPRTPTPAPAPAPAPVPVPFQPQPFRPQVPITQAGPAAPRPPVPVIPTIVTPRASAPPSPIAPPPPRATAPASPPSKAPPPPQATAPPSSPSKAPPPATLINTLTDQSPKSPATPSTIRSPTITSAQSPPPPIFFKPTSPVTKSSTSLPASPGQKASTQIIVTRPEVSYSSLPSSPKTKPSAPPPSPQPTTPAFRTVPSSPAPPAPSPVTNAVHIPKVTARGATTSAMASPKVEKPWVESPPQSVKEKLLSYPPSPLALPPAQIKAGSDLEPIPAEAEQKTVLMQEKEEKSKGTPKIKTSNGYVIRPQSETNDNNVVAQQVKSRDSRKGKVISTPKKQSDSEEYYGARVVTLAGENKGAVMELSPSRKKNGAGAWSNIGQKLEELSSRKKDEKHKAGGMETAPMDAFVNCNVQGVNNSILYNCSCTHNDPGVHLALSRKSNGGRGAHH